MFKTLVASGFATFGLAKRAFVIIDTQECFLEQGSLPVRVSNIIPNVNRIRESGLFDVIVLSQDHHPAGHVSFGTAHGMADEKPNAAMSNSWRGWMEMMCVKPGEGNAGCCPLYHINRAAVNCTAGAYAPGPDPYCPTEANSNFTYDAATNPMIQGNTGCTICKDTPDKCFSMNMDLWLDHCLKDGDSAFAANLTRADTDKIVQKGDRHVEMFSAFYDNTKNYMSDLNKTLTDAGVTEIFVAGIATTHCVRWTVQDGLALGYKTNIIIDASAGIYGTPTSYDNETEAKADFTKQGITVLTTAEVLEMVTMAPSVAPTMDPDTVVKILDPDTEVSAAGVLSTRILQVLLAIFAVSFKA